MQNFSQIINYDNLHHAYGIESLDRNIVQEIKKFISQNGNDYIFLKEYDTFYIDDARTIKSLQAEKTEENKKRFFVLSVNFITKEAQNALLKVFEEPSLNTYFFLVIPSMEDLLPTLKSRLFILDIEKNEDLSEAIINIEDFLKMELKERFDLVKRLTEKKNGDMQLTKIEALKFMRRLETKIYEIKNDLVDADYIFQEIFMINKYLKRNGSSVKMLMDHCSVVIPVLS